MPLSAGAAPREVGEILPDGHHAAREAIRAVEALRILIRWVILHPARRPDPAKDAKGAVMTERHKHEAISVAERARPLQVWVTGERLVAEALVRGRR